MDEYSEANPLCNYMLPRLLASRRRRIYGVCRPVNLGNTIPVRLGRLISNSEMR